MTIDGDPTICTVAGRAGAGGDGGEGFRDAIERHGRTDERAQSPASPLVHDLGMRGYEE